MRAGGGGVAVAVTKMYVLPFFSRAEQRPFKIPVHVPGAHRVTVTGVESSNRETCRWWQYYTLYINASIGYGVE